jgi:hypothetical protein
MNPTPGLVEYEAPCEMVAKGLGDKVGAIDCCRLTFHVERVDDQ